MTTTDRTLVCIPTYNERENIVPIVTAVLEMSPAVELLIVDDASPDGTGATAEELAKKDPRVHVLHRPVKSGLGHAYIAAFCWAMARDYDKIVEFDADFSHNPVYLPEMLVRLERCDVVVGSRRVPGGESVGWTLPRRLISLGGSLYARTLLGGAIHDLTGGFNGFRAEALLAVDYSTIRAQGYMFQVEIKHRAQRAGLKVEEMPIVFVDRTRGTSKMSAAIFAEAMLGVARLKLGRAWVAKPREP
ncbi:MAG: polyprenol monophosphomannose synthase [Myxococcota bacterium]|jgi:dolichol-phosphate mannosyltransferase|nr:polyprenol monophosphomannose synthase [Myxococcota bacterium]